MKLTKKAAIITSVILGAGLVAASGAYYFFNSNVEPETVAEAPVEAKKETSKRATETKKNTTTKNDGTDTKEFTVTQEENTADASAQTPTTQPAADVTATTEKEMQVAQAAPSTSTASSKKATSQQKTSSQKTSSTSKKPQTASKPVSAAQPANQPAASTSQNTSENTPGKRELYLPQGHYEKRVVKPAYTAYDVQAFEEPVMETFCVFYGNDGNVLKEFSVPETKSYTDENGDFRDPLGEYSMYVVHNHLGGGNWMVEQHKVGTIQHDAQYNLTQEQFDAYMATLKSKWGLVYAKKTVPEETEEIFVPNN